MSLEPLVVGSIKDRVVCSVWALGELATRDRLSKAVDCNGALLSIAIEGLERDGYMRLGEAGHYTLADDLAATMPPAKRSPSESNPVERNDVPVAPAPAASATPEVFDMASKKRCTSCREEKDAEKDFYAHQGKCKPCYLQRQRAKNAKHQNKNGTAPPPASADELVIPAAGEIRCRVIHTELGPAIGFAIQQGNDQVVCSLDQLQVLRDWATSQLKKGERDE